MCKTQQFIEKAILIHGNKFNYSLVKYRRHDKKIKIICSNNHIFEQTPSKHFLCSIGCRKCINESQHSNTSTFINKVKEIHGNKFNYSLVNYKNDKEKVKIKCENNHIFEQTPKNHLKGNGCPLCYNQNRVLNTEQFIEAAIKIHGNRYDYSQVKYIHSKEKISIKCKIHGFFEQIPNSHLIGSNCPQCILIKTNTTEFIQKASKKHNNFYDYSLVNYINVNTKIKIICPIHGIFEQKPNGHLTGNGCSFCKNISGQKEFDFLQELKKYLPNNNIIYQAKFDWLKLQQIDFFIEEKNIAIEYQGQQHFIPVKHWGGEVYLKKTQERDKNKKMLCEQHSIKIFYFSYDISYIPLNCQYKIYSKIEDLLLAINN